MDTDACGTYFTGGMGAGDNSVYGLVVYTSERHIVGYYVFVSLVQAVSSRNKHIV